MATREEIERIAESLPQVQPTNFFKIVNDSRAGIGFALRLLYSSPSGRLTAGEISEAMCVSTARVAVLLKKMEAKGLVVKEHDSRDARVRVVFLSEHGRAVAERMRENMLHDIELLIDRIGLERLNLFVELSAEVKGAMADIFSADHIERHDLSNNCKENEL